MNFEKEVLYYEKTTDNIMIFLTDLFLAWRYFKPKRSAVSVITLISVIGVALGVCVLIVVLAVMTGFTDHLQEKIIETGAHGQIQKIRIQAGMPGAAARSGVITEAEAIALKTDLERRGAESLAVIRMPVLMQLPAGNFKNGFFPKMLLAFDPEVKSRRLPVADAVKKAAANEAARAKKDGGPVREFGRYSLGPHEILIGTGMANEFHLQAGDKVILHTSQRLLGMVRQDERGNYEIDREAEKYIPAEFTIAGVYTFDKYDFDREAIFMNLYEADSLFGFGDGDATHLFLWVDDPFHMNAFNQAMHDQFTPARNFYSYQSWEEMNRDFLNVLAVEKNMMFFLLVFIVLVAAFSITNTLITTVIQKTKEIGLLKAMGANSGTILRIFLLQGMFVGFIGSCFGVLFGWLVVKYRMVILETMRRVTGMEIFPSRFYLFNELPAHIIWSDVALIFVIGIVLCTFGALIPAFRAAKLDPARALRYE